MHMVSKHIPRVGIGGPVGSGKTALIERIVPLLSKRGYKVGIVSNDVVSREDAERMRKNLAREGVVAIILLQRLVQHWQITLSTL
jgi:Ni2+-binding GTPase involved in maturation of urease and hydrogenase